MQHWTCPKKKENLDQIGCCCNETLQICTSCINVVQSRTLTVPAHDLGWQISFPALRTDKQKIYLFLLCGVFSVLPWQWLALPREFPSLTSQKMLPQSAGRPLAPAWKTSGSPTSLSQEVSRKGLLGCQPSSQGIPQVILHRSSLFLLQEWGSAANLCLEMVPTSHGQGSEVDAGVVVLLRILCLNLLSED